MAEMGVCPVCNGTTRKDAGTKSWRTTIYGYDKIDNTVPCTNCGGQRQYSDPVGKVQLRRDNGQPCVHEYTETQLGRCYRGYTCKHCGDYYTIDSGD